MEKPLLRIKKTVLVTRPEPLASPFAERLESFGYHVLIEPLLSIQPCFVSVPVIDDDIPLVITSRIALSVLASYIKEIQGLLGHPCYCIGDRTGLEARGVGFRNVFVGSGTGRDLASLILQNESNLKKILYIGGQDISSDLPNILEEAGFALSYWPIYRAEVLSDFSLELITALKQKTIDVAMFFSKRTAQAFTDVALRKDLAFDLEDVTALVMSESSLKPLNLLSWRRILVATSPSEEGIVQSLNHLFL